MGETIFIPPQAVIYIIGAPCSGKSTLARQIAHDTPGSAELISADEVFEKIFGITAEDALCDPIKIQELGGRSKLDAIYSYEVRQKLAKALLGSSILIYEGAPNDSLEVKSFLTATTVARMGGPLILIGMDPTEAVYREFCAERRRIGRCLPQEVLDMAILTMRKFLDQDYTCQFRNLAQYRITNPREVKLNFM